MERSINWREYFILTLGYIFILSIVFLIINVIHFKLLSPQIILHAMLLDMLMALLLGAWLLHIFFPFHAILLTNASIIFLSFAFLYSILGPTMCDRSLSVFLLMEVQEANQLHQQMTTNDLVKLTNEKYIKGPRMVEKRLTEHEASGAIKIHNHVVSLTPAGKLMAHVFDFFYWLLGIQRNF